MAYTIDKKKCMRCGTCDVECPFHAVCISDEGEFSIDHMRGPRAPPENPNHDRMMNEKDRKRMLCQETDNCPGRILDPEKCKSCGVCLSVCPVDAPQKG